MKLFNRKPLVDAVWEITKKQYPEWNGPKTPEEGISNEEKNEKVDYSENTKK